MSLEARVFDLKAAGAERFDAADVRFIESLLERAQGAPESARARLKGRARKHLFALEMRFGAARRMAADAVERLVASSPDAAERAKDLVDDGDVLAASRLAERVKRRLESTRWRRASSRLARVLALVDARCQPRPSAAKEARALLESPDVDGDAARRAQRLANVLTLCLLTEAAERSCAQLEVDRLKRGMLPEMGPYNPDALATQALDEIAALSPAYLRAYLAWVGDLEVLTRLAPSPQETKGEKAKGEKKGRRR